MTTRFGRLKTLDEKFGFLFNISKLFANDTSNDIQQHCATLADFYKTDIDGTELFVEISDCIASSERSFSKLKIILTYLRASMGQERLSDLALLSIEKELVETINFDDVIDNFASARSRKVVL
ncbi:Zinc finger MYM-type protein 1 [Biomphalaria glabrata]|nr:Zinc finger MYM-type protein 1 [Biomphalaria glabrata]